MCLIIHCNRCKRLNNHAVWSMHLLRSYGFHTDWRHCFITGIIWGYTARASDLTTPLISWRSLAETNEWCRSWWSGADDKFHISFTETKERKTVTPEQHRWSSRQCSAIWLKAYSLIWGGLSNQQAFWQHWGVTNASNNSKLWSHGEPGCCTKSVIRPLWGAAAKSVGLFKGFNLSLG